MNEQRQLDITQMNVDQLKAIAFDLVCQRDQAIQNLQVISQEIVKKQQGEIRPDAEAEWWL